MPAPRIPRIVTRRKFKPDLRRRAQHLAFVRQLPCVACGKAAPSEAAHVRTGTDGGVGVKPGDRYAVPLCTVCHAKQHRIGELTFWSALRIDPLNVALRLWTVSADIKAGERTVFRARQQIDLAKACGVNVPANRPVISNEMGREQHRQSPRGVAEIGGSEYHSGRNDADDYLASPTDGNQESGISGGAEQIAGDDCRGVAG
jgi:hypothetical protein